MYVFIHMNFKIKLFCDSIAIFVLIKKINFLRIEQGCINQLTALRTLNESIQTTVSLILLFSIYCRALVTPMASVEKKCSYERASEIFHVRYKHNPTLPLIWRHLNKYKYSLAFDLNFL